MTARKKNKKSKFPRSLFVDEFNSVIFLSALSLNFLLLGLLMSSVVKQRDVMTEQNVALIVSAETKVLGEAKVDVKSLPENFPEDFPLYFATKLTDAWTREDGGLDAISVVWETNDSPKKVFNYYLDQLRLFGWDSEVILESDASYTISFQKEMVGGFVGVSTSEPNKTIISATFGIRR